MISNAPRVFCAIPSTVGAAGSVIFANPANSFATPDAASAPAAIAASTPTATAYRG